MNCDTCHDTAYVCFNCEHPECECLCDCGPQLVRCTECPVEDEDDGA